MDFKTISYQEEKDFAILTITRPESMNALNSGVLRELGEAFLHLQNYPVRALIITGQGERAFVAGADIKEMESMTEAQAKEFCQRGQKMFRQLEKFEFPTIAAVNGFALGGGLELALACDWMIASRTAKWGLPEVSLGLIPGYGGTQRLSRVIGKSLAKRVALTGGIFSADEGFAWGLFTAVVDPAEVMTMAKAQASLVASRAPKAVGFAKQAIESGFDETLERGLEIEAQLFARAFGTEDHTEGIQAFIGKRPPKFTGR